jgi:hypothetical protein
LFCGAKENKRKMEEKKFETVGEAIDRYLSEYRKASGLEKQVKYMTAMLEEFMWTEIWKGISEIEKAEDGKRRHALQDLEVKDGYWHWKDDSR